MLERPFEFRFAIKNEACAVPLNDSARRDAVNNFVVCATEDEGNKIEPTIGIVNQVFYVSAIISQQYIPYCDRSDDNHCDSVHHGLPEPSVAPEPRDPANPEKPILLDGGVCGEEPSMRFVFSVNVTDDELADS